MSELAQQLDAIAAQVRVCTLCELHRGRTNAVPGAGNPAAEILFIGEGPGFNEDKQGLPFVGRSGDLLTKLIGMIGLTRADVFITNVVKCRPPDNRDPLPVEIATCAPYLNEQESLIDPLIIVTLGRFSMARYFEKVTISKVHGQPKYDGHRAYLPLYHPAAVLRNPGLIPEMEADFRKIPALVERVKVLRAEKAAGIPYVPPGAKPAPDATDDPAPAAPPEADAPQPSTNDNELPTQLSLF